MNATAVLVLKGILLSIHQMSGAALALLNDGDADALESALGKLQKLPRMFGESTPPKKGDDDGG